VIAVTSSVKKEWAKILDNYKEEIIDGIEKTNTLFEEEAMPDPNLKSLKVHIHKAGELDEEQAWKIAERLVKNGYVVAKEDKLAPETELEKIKIEDFKNESNYVEPFLMPEHIEKPSSSQYAHYFAPWLIEKHDVRAVLLDYNHNSYELWSYMPEKKIWVNNGLQKLKKIAPEQIGEDYSRNVRREIIERLEGKKVIEYENMGVGEGKLAVKNGLLDFQDNKVRDIQKEDLVTSKLPVAFEGDIEIPEIWDEKLQEWTTSENAKKTLQEFAGYCLMPWTSKFERGLMLLGPTDSGKSVFLDVMRELLGDENVSQESLQDLTNTRWAVASLKGKIANIDHDLDPKSIQDVGTVKKLTSGNEMMAERKHDNKFGIKPTAKLMFSANRVPDRNKEDDAFYNRWLTVPFPETIPEDQQDPDLLEKLTEKENLRGILKWAIKGLERLMEKKGFTGDLDPLATKELWKEWGNSVERFISRYCIKEKEVPEEEREKMDFKVHFSTLYELYQEFAQMQGMEKESKKGFSNKLKSDPQVRKGQPSIRGKQDRGFFGLKLKEEAYKDIKEGDTNDER
jgi:putative DNA primase/helicase